ncbi:hypothetical protein Ahy_A10g047834 [Arachis hypogaea]|uniref:Transposase MuDR plant domain-containing protein n=1 Tax=Arachis hypogaea TaxID=3818 RepID=A0A445B3P7_ARAHY|nr:hypothetical protein Ahy_A10g047834 [Arachis hypogaea]
MCKIAEKRGHVELYVVRKVEDAEEFSEVGFLDVGGQGEQGQEAERGNAEELHNQNRLVKSNSDDDSDDEDFIPSDGEVDSADDVMFTNSEEEYDDESGFDEVRGGTDGDRVDKGKGVTGGDFSDEEGFNSDKVDVDYEMCGGSEKEDSEDDDNNEASRYPIHKDVKDMTSLDKLHWMRFRELTRSSTRGLLTTAQSCYGLIHGHQLRSRSRFYFHFKCDTLVNNTCESYNGAIVKYRKKPIVTNVRGHQDLWEKTNFDDVMPPPYRKPSHRPVKKRKRGPDKAPESSQSHLSRRGQIQRCSNCGESRHKRGGCKKPSLDAQQPRQAAIKRTKRGRKPSSSRLITSSKTSSQPAIQSASGGRRRSTRSKASSQPQSATTSSKPISTYSRSKPTSPSTRPNSLPAGTLHGRAKRKPIRNTTQQPPAPKEKGASNSSQPARTVSFSHRIPLHVSPRKLRLMAKLPPRLWGKL